MSLFSFTLALPFSTTSPSLNQVIQSVSTPLAFFFFLFILHPTALSPDQRWSSCLSLPSQLSHSVAKLEGNKRTWRQWQSLKMTVAMADLEGDNSDGKVWRRPFAYLGFSAVGHGFHSPKFACHGSWLLLAYRGLWLSITGVCCHGLNQFLRLGLEWVVGLNRLLFLGWFQIFCGVRCCFDGG